MIPLYLKIFAIQIKSLSLQKINLQRGTCRNKKYGLRSITLVPPAKSSNVRNVGFFNSI